MISDTESTCPVTKCPPKRWPAAIALSRFTVLPFFRLIKAVTFNVSFKRLKEAPSGVSPETVRQHPLTAMLSPIEIWSLKGMST